MQAFNFPCRGVASTSLPPGSQPQRFDRHLAGATPLSNYNPSTLVLPSSAPWGRKTAPSSWITISSRIGRERRAESALSRIIPRSLQSDRFRDAFRPTEKRDGEINPESIYASTNDIDKEKLRMYNLKDGGAYRKPTVAEEEEEGEERISPPRRPLPDPDHLFDSIVAIPTADQVFWVPKKGEYNIRTPYATRARVVPIEYPHRLKNDNGEYYEVDIEREYSREWPSFKTLEGRRVFNLGFLSPYKGDNLLNGFVYSGLERFSYTFPDKVVRTALTTLCMAVYSLAFSAFYAWNPMLAIASIISWLRGTLSFSRVAILLALTACELMWMYWAALVYKIISNFLGRHSEIVQSIAQLMFFSILGLLFFSHAAFNVVPLPFGRLDAPFPIPRLT